MFLRANSQQKKLPQMILSAVSKWQIELLAIFTEQHKSQRARERKSGAVSHSPPVGQTCAQLYFTALGAAINFPGTEQYFSGTDHTLTTTTQFAAA